MKTRLFVLLALASVMAGCGMASTFRTPPTDRIERIPGSSFKRVVLTPLGARRIGIQTTLVKRVRLHPRGRLVDVIPDSAVVYDIHGHPYTYTRLVPLQFVRRPILITRNTGKVVFLGSGLRAGTRVVTVGGEELLGVELGVTSGE
jgi:hypothetical protein